MTFEQRQQAEEEIAAFIHCNTAPADRERWKALTKLDLLTMLYGQCAVMFDSHMHGGRTAEAQIEVRAMMRLKSLLYSQMWIEDHPA